MTHTKTPMATDPSRRTVLGSALALGAALALPGAAFALTDGEARALIDRAVGEVNAVINSGKPEAAMIADFETIFVRYADLAVIAQSSLGVAARQATPAQLQAYAAAFKGYIARKYGRRFREFIGSRIEVTGAKQVKSFYEVSSIAYFKNQAPFEVLWQVSDKSGKNLFFNIIIEGVNMLASERTEIGAMLDQRRGNIDALIADLQKL